MSYFNKNIKKEWIKTPQFSAAAVAFLYGTAVHAFSLNNVLQNHDNIASQPGGYGTGVELGRWFLEVLGRILEIVGLNYNLPSVNGMLYIMILSLTAALLVCVLKVNSKKNAALIGALFISFPTVSATMIYRFTTVFYGIGTLLAVMAVWVLRRYRWGVLLSAVLVMLSMGIYQAYAPLTIALFVLVLILEGLRGEADAKTLVIHGLYDCLALLLGLLMYFAGTKLAVWMKGVSLNEYQGVNTMGLISLSQMPQLLIKAFKSVCLLPVQDYCGVANRAVMRIAYLLLGMITVVMTGKIFVRKTRKVGTAVIICLLYVAFLLAVGFVEVMVPNGWIYTLMVYSYCLLACAPVVISECLSDEKKHRRGDAVCKKAASILAAMLVMFYGYYANVNYMAAYYAGEQVENYLSGVVIRTTMTEGYTVDKQWVFIGEIEDALLGTSWKDEITYTGIGFTEYLLNQYSRNDWIEHYIGYQIPVADEQTLQMLKNSNAVRNMPCYPDAGSVKVLGDNVVIKFENIAE